MINYKITKNKDGNIYYLEIDGKIVLDNCLEINAFSEGFAKFKRKDGKEGWIATKGKIYNERHYK